MKYYAHIYIRNGGCHTKWCYQERNKTFSITIQDEHSPILKSNAEHTAVYIRCQSDAISEVSKELLCYIGGQTHIIFGKHKLPMIPVPDRKANYICGRNEHFRCPDLECSIFICDKCAANYDLSIINEVNEDAVAIAYDDPLFLSPTASFEQDESKDDNNSSVEIHEGDAGDDNDHTYLNGGVVNASYDCALERESFDDFVTCGITDAFGGYDSDDIFIAGNENEVEEFFHITMTYSGDLPF